MFRSADVIAINKMDLAPHLDVDFDMNLFYRNLRDVHPKVKTIEVSAKTGDEIDDWCDWIRGLLTTR
jgi:hydrogenase nickel incorporation protein HypB